MTRSHRRGDEGSIFVESLVAVAIVALMSGALFTFTAQSAARRGLIEQRRLAVMVARSHLDAAAADVGPGGGRARGEDAGLVWEVTVEPQGQTGVTDGVTLDRVEATVRTRGGAVLTRLATIRVGSAS